MEPKTTSIPNSVLLSKKISNGAKVVYALLAMYAEQGVKDPDQKLLAEGANCSERMIRSYLNELRNTGFITWKQRGLTKTNVYFLLEGEK